MRKFLKKLFGGTKAFTLMECVLASAIVAAGSTLLLSMISMGYSYISRSRSLDTMASVAQQKIVTYSGAEAAQEGLVPYGEDTGIQYGYSDKLQATVSFEIHYGNSNKTDVIMPDTIEYVAVIVTDNKDNKIVYYMVSPKDGKIKGIYEK